MDSHRVIVVLVLIDSWRELNVNVLCNACRNHSLLLVTNLEVLGLRREDVKALWGGRVVDQSQFHGVRFICLKAGKLDHAGRGTEYPVGAHSVIHVLLGDAQALVCFCLPN